MWESPVRASGFLWLSVCVLVVGPKSPSPGTLPPAVRCNYMKSAKAAVAYWHVVRNTRTIFGGNGLRVLGAFWPGIKKAGTHVSREQAPILLSGIRFLSLSAASSVEVIRRAVRGGALSNLKDGQGELVLRHRRPSHSLGSGARPTLANY